jgi:hypothetical protein
MSKLIDFISGGLGSELVKGVAGFIKGQFPDKLSEADQLAIQIKMTELTNQQINKASQIAHAEAAEFNARIKDMEGTAADLKAIPILGPFMLFLRGSQRPVWSMGTLYFDYLWFTSGTSFDEQQNTALIVVNSLVLGFLFGERALKNLEPMIVKVFSKT